MSAPSADHPAGPGERQYHIGLAPGEVARGIILVGDPARARRFSGLFSRVRVERSHREYVTFTGDLGGQEITVMATGMGCDNTEIAVLELLRCREDPVFLRVGSSGGLQPELEVGDLVISTGAVRLENTSLAFVHPGFPALAHHEVIQALIDAGRELDAPCHVGLTATAPGFYGWQGRSHPCVEPLRKGLLDDLAHMGVLNLEMETSTLLTLSMLAKVRAGAVCTVFANRPANTFIEADARAPAEDRALDVAVRALGTLLAT